MVDLVKIRKKAKEKPEDAKPETNAPVTAVATAVEPVAETVAQEKRTKRPTADEASSEQRAASRGERQSRPEKPAPKPAAAATKAAEPTTATDPKKNVEAPKAAEPAPKAISKLEQYKQQAGRRREKAEGIGTTAAGAAAAEENQLELLTFAITGESYAIEIDKIVEIVPPRAATKVPNASAAIVGIISLRGTIVTLIDVRRRLKQAGAEPTTETRIIVLEHEGETVGFEVDRVFRVVKIAASEVEPHPVVHASEQDESIRGVFRHGESLTILLDFAKLLGGREVARTGPRQAVTASRR